MWTILQLLFKKNFPKDFFINYGLSVCGPALMNKWVENPLMRVVRGFFIKWLSETVGKIVLHSIHKMNKMLISFSFKKE
jgi:hypothetical protein